MNLGRNDSITLTKDSNSDENQDGQSNAAANILNWPNNRLRRKTSINDLLGQEKLEKEQDVLMKSNSKLNLKMEVGLVS